MHIFVKFVLLEFNGIKCAPTDNSILSELFDQQMYNTNVSKKNIQMRIG